ncbi:DegT/DnrJ/EryC1/StrS family aminotransferase [Streptomyces ipomoeae]|uniref:DegT/DnrJ/EryC1/StrS family aminotransferase n=1 Tax=Streptomyces ipomoeae TaxID=103232 RepID=UPI001147350D|nr:DegT/DnrJ/EryC1/StrS family aminotransferase [Streptomyces ipomoeae]TQE22803.1 aminotransferase class I/II-fold pyridoxal phosphate-dependent enzyme [Streptomyces ipomoeae]
MPGRPSRVAPRVGSMNVLVPNAAPHVTDAELQAVRDVLISGAWTGGEQVASFERELAAALDAPHVVTVASGTAALHAVLTLLRVPGTRQLLVTSDLNFLAAPSTALHLGYEIAFTDIAENSLNMDPEALETLLRESGPDYDDVIVVPVHFAGLAAGMDDIHRVCAEHGARVVEDAAHAIGARYADGRPVGSDVRSVACVFSFHPTKNVATPEGGAISVHDADVAGRLRLLRNHGMDKADLVDAEDAFAADGTRNPWYYQVRSPGLNLRLSDVHAAVGRCQLGRLAETTRRRRDLAERYHQALSGVANVAPATETAIAESVWHLYPAILDIDALALTKQEVFARFAADGIALQVHYTPLHRQPAYANRPLVAVAKFPVVERVSRGLVSLPMFTGMSDVQQELVVAALRALPGGAR